MEESQQVRVMKELHEGVSGSHIGGRALALKILRAGFYWPSLREDCLVYVRRFDNCQRHSNQIHASVERLYSLVSPWPFSK